MTVPGPPPSAALVEMLRGFMVSSALYAVADLGVATVLEQEGPTTVAELAERTGAQPEPLGRLVRALAPLGVFRTDGGRVDVTPVGALLSEKHPQSMHGLARMWMEQHYLQFSELSYGVRTGRCGAEHYLGRPFWEWVALDPQREALFSRAMADITGSLRAGMFDDYRLPEGKVVADIGGADGSVLVELLTRDDDPARRGVVFDRPTTVPAAHAALGVAGLTDRVDVVAGDFFVEVPTADIYLLSYILHDWDDAACGRIVASIAAAAAPGARLLVVESVVPEGDDPHLSKAIDLTMLGMLPGKERTADEYRALLDGAGFTLDRIVATPTPFSILEATLR